MKNQANVVVKQRIIPELVSGSSTQSVTQRQALKTLKKFQGLSYFIVTRSLALCRHAEFISASSRYDNNQTLKQVQGDGRRGFTLIELLVVVLIIGILAAVAVPQYQKVVDKQKLLPIIVAGKTIRDGLKLFMLENGREPEAKELEIWDSFDEQQNAYYLQGRRYFWLGGWYVRSYFPLDLTCDWALISRKGQGWCSTSNKRTINLLKSIGWEVQNENDIYTWFYIPGMKERIVKP